MWRPAVTDEELNRPAREILDQVGLGAGPVASRSVEARQDEMALTRRGVEIGASDRADALPFHGHGSHAGDPLMGAAPFGDHVPDAVAGGVDGLRDGYLCHRALLG